jgi:hypothetical protein
MGLTSNNWVENPWRFIVDANHDGQFTIGDVFAWLIQLLYLPGDGVIYLALTQLPGPSRFFEFSITDYQGLFSGVVSFLVWLIVYVYLVVLSNWLEKRREARFARRRRELGYDDGNT